MTEAPGGPGVQVLRAATREAHARLDALVDLRSWNRATHEWWLQRMLGLHEPLEHELGVWRTAWVTPDRPHTPDVAVRRRAGAITADLITLGLTETQVRALPRSPLPPAPTERGRALGQLYVLDGSALGGAVIATHAIAGGIPPEACTSLAHSRERITSWRETKNLLNELTGEELDRAVRAAVELFAVFEAWLRTPVPAR